MCPRDGARVVVGGGRCFIEAKSIYAGFPGIFATPHLIDLRQGIENADLSESRERRLAVPP